jgi:hypothetical protein
MPWSNHPASPDRGGSRVANGAEDAPFDVPPEAEAFIREEAWAAIAPGFRTLDDVTETMVELVEDDDPLTADNARGIVMQLWNLRLQQLAAPAERTPSDDVRVATAFAELTSFGIVATMFLGFDRSEGVELSTELMAQRADSRGFAYFHSQDAARLGMPRASLYIGFGAQVPQDPAADGDAADVAIGREIAAVLAAHGLVVAWDGAAESRILLENVDWRRPLPSA